jgi:hypothetical protein
MDCVLIQNFEFGLQNLDCRVHVFWIWIIEFTIFFFFF